MFNKCSSTSIFATLKSWDSVSVNFRIDENGCGIRSSIFTFQAVASRTDLLVRIVVQRRRIFRGLKASSKKIGRNAHAHSFGF